MEDKREQLQREGYVILSQVVPAEQLARLRLDIEAVVQRQRAADPAWDSTSQPRAQIAKFVDAETLGALEFLVHDHTYGISARLLGCPDAAVAATAAEVLCNPEFTPGAPSPPGQSWGTDPRNWHRDVRPDTDGPLEPLLEDQRANGPAHVQWNIALYEDQHLHVVPGSQRRLTQQIETSHLERESVGTLPLPASRRVELGPGDGVVYNNAILHWGSEYSAAKKRRTLHLGYRSFGRILPNSRECRLPVNFAARFARETQHRRIADRWLALVGGEFLTLREMFQAALAGDERGFLVGLDRLHPPEEGRLACLILLTKIVLELRGKKRSGGVADLGADQSVYEWQLGELAAHFQDAELEQLARRFERVDELLRSDAPKHVSGFLGPTTDYEFETAAAGTTAASVVTAILQR